MAAVVDRRSFHWISVRSFGDGDSTISIRGHAQLAGCVRELPPSLEPHVGRHVSGVARGDGGIDWSFGRKRGIGL